MKAIEAKWQKKLDNDKILCELCPRYCNIGKGQIGFCFVRQNIDGKLYNLAYGRPTGFAIDPIEKKPLYHFLPGSKILSFGTAGCNLGCKFCQNWNISKAKIDSIDSLEASPEFVVSLAKKYNTPSIAFTYNEPTIFAEYIIDVSKIAHSEGIKTVMVTNGYISKEARKEVYDYIDAANVDLKAFSQNFYKKITLSNLTPVLENLIWLKNETGIWLEITNLLIPDENDSEDEIKRMCEWIANNLGLETPMHFTVFHPDYKMLDKIATPAETLNRACNIAKSFDLKYVYVGNIFSIAGQTTYCPNCSAKLIVRSWHNIQEYRLNGDRCRKCGSKIAGVF
jgi:pyruvate formate lyase activating enzyme